MRERTTEVYCDGIRNLARHFPTEALPFKAEDTAPHAIQGDWNDGSIDVLHNALKTALKWEHEADARDLTLGKDAGNVAILDRLARRSQ